MRNSALVAQMGEQAITCLAQATRRTQTTWWDGRYLVRRCFLRRLGGETPGDIRRRHEASGAAPDRC